MTWAELQALADREVHVVGLASTEGTAMVRFLWSEGVRRLTAHDFQPPERLEATFRRFHVGMPPAERERVWQELSELPITRRLGPHYLEGVGAAEVLFVGQAWNLYAPNLPALTRLQAAGVPFHGLTELYFDLAAAPILAVTGSNGKSTTSRLVESILRQTGRTIYYAGNERRSVQVLDRLRAMQPEDWLVLEVSNRQLVDLSPDPAIGVVTNILPNHLDEHGGSFEAYAAVKRRLVAGQSRGGVAVINADDPPSRQLAGGLPGQVIWFSRRQPVERGAWLEDGHIRLRRAAGSVAVDGGPVAAARLAGAHNEENVLAAAAAAWWAGAGVPEIQAGLRSFRGLRHRMQLVWSAGGVDYYDDLNATTPQATVAALQALPGPVVLIAGGDDKGLELGELAERIAAHVRRLVLLPGPGSERLAAAVTAARAGAAGPGPAVDRFHTFRDAVADVVATARPGETVLLSPAGPFFFSRHYLGDGAEETGFRALLRELGPARSPAEEVG